VRDGGASQRRAAIIISRTTASSIESSPRQPIAGVGQMLWKDSDALRSASAAMSVNDRV
jgi:hypothetical protein